MEEQRADIAFSKTAELPPVLDACCGGRMFWFDKNDRRGFFVDKRKGTFPLLRQKKIYTTIRVMPDWQGSFTALPFASESFFHVVFDPPHDVLNPGTGNVYKTYGRLSKNWKDELGQGFAECFRVLLPGGTLIFKWSERDIPLREILALTPEKPLYGHRSGRRERTHWVAFIKGFGEAASG
jgi:SAM-dependent methyltransferase